MTRKLIGRIYGPSGQRPFGGSCSEKVGQFTHKLLSENYEMITKVAGKTIQTLIVSIHSLSFIEYQLVRTDATVQPPNEPNKHFTKQYDNRGNNNQE